MAGNEKAAQTEEDLDRQLKEIRAQRSTQGAEIEQKTKRRKLRDLTVIAGLEGKLGPQNVKVLEVAFIDDETPVFIAVRTPRAVEVKSYRDGLTADENGKVDRVGPTEAIGQQCLIYPDPDSFERVKAARPQALLAMGLAALELSGAEEERKGKG